VPRPCLKNPVSKMDKRVSLQTVTQSTDSQGGYTDSWATTATVWASIEPLKGYEKYQAMQMETPITHKVMTRYDSRITTAKRLLYGSRIFNIKEAINEGEQNTFLRLLCTEMATA
jgi:SPP1 family predicted phage head-tail adaptor